jgi:hypothetical protein
VLPVTSILTNVTYANRHCAACNYDNESVVKWRVECEHSQELYDAYSDEEYGRRALQRPELCGVVKPAKERLSDSAYHICDPADYRLDNVVTSCNETGEWLETDVDKAERVRQACSTTDWSLRTVVRVYWRAYSNAFCALCNVRQISVLCVEVESRSFIIRTGTSLVAFKLPEPTIKKVDISGNESVCESGYWRHPQVSHHCR